MTKLKFHALQRLAYAMPLGMAMLSTGALSQAASSTPTVTPQTFAYKTQIDMPAGGPFYSFSLPLQVYQGAQQQDLGDLRVFNGQGEAVPHTLLRPQITSTSKDASIAVPVFSITKSAAMHDDTADVTLDVQRKSDGTLIAVKKGGDSKTVQVVQGAVFDISRIKENVRALHLATAPSNVPFHSLRIDTSDDLQQWRTLQGKAQLVHLQQGGQTIDKDTFEWDGAAGKYLRVLWHDAAQAPAIVSASVIASHIASDGAQMLWTEPIKPQKTEGNHFDYAIAGQLPLERLRIDLAEINTLAPLQVQRYLAPSAQRQHGAWATMMQSVVYRLQSPQGEIVSPDLVFDATPEPHLRLEVDASSGGIGNIAPSVQVGFTPQVLVFLPRGTGPFTLAWGANNVADAAMSAATLIPNFSEDREIAASAATLQAIAPLPVSGTAPEQAPKEAKTSKGLLWSVLAVGLLVLVAMVGLLVKQIRQGQTAEK